jgi:predicted MFS family arabinose efflux permease
MTPAKPAPPVFTRYQVFIIALLTILQFTVVLDFMVLSPLGAVLMPDMHISAAQFGLVVSAYAFSAGLSGLLAAGFADKFDRKKLLLFFYTGFVVGTLLCGLAPTYPLLLGARIVTGLFGGVIGSIGFAIITDLFPLEVRGRVMGFVQMAFASSQVLGIPVGLYLANRFDWHAPFLLIVAVSLVVGVAMVRYMRPVTAHLALPSRGNAFTHLVGTLSRPAYLRAFAAATLLASGGFMLMPFGSAYTVNNLGIAMDQLPFIYLVTGLCSMVIGPLAGRLQRQGGQVQAVYLRHPSQRGVGAGVLPPGRYAALAGHRHQRAAVCRHHRPDDPGFGPAFGHSRPAGPGGVHGRQLSVQQLAGGLGFGPGRGDRGADGGRAARQLRAAGLRGGGGHARDAGHDVRTGRLRKETAPARRSSAVAGAIPYDKCTDE